MFIYRGFLYIFITHKSGWLCVSFFSFYERYTQTGSPWTWPRIERIRALTHTYTRELSALKCMRMCIGWMWFLFLSLRRSPWLLLLLVLFFFFFFFDGFASFFFLSFVPYYFHFIVSHSFSFDDYFPDSLAVRACVWVNVYVRDSLLQLILLRISFSLFTALVLSLFCFWIGDSFFLAG